MIRSDFSSRIATHIGVEPQAFQKTLESHPQAVSTLPTEPYEAVELGFEKALQFTAGAADQYRDNPAGLKPASDAMRKENPKAFDAVGNMLLQTSASVSNQVAFSHFKSFGDGVCAVQMNGEGFNGTLWIDTTPGEAGIESLMLDNAKCKGPNPCIAPPPPRAGEVTDNPIVDAHVFGPVASELGADKLFTGLNDEKLTRFVDWATGKIDLPFNSPLSALPEGWTEMGEFDGRRLDKSDNYCLGNPWGNHQILSVDTKTGEVTLLTEHDYRRPGDFEGSSDTVTLKRYADGETRREYHEMHD